MHFVEMLLNSETENVKVFFGCKAVKVFFCPLELENIATNYPKWQMRNYPDNVQEFANFRRVMDSWMNNWLDNWLFMLVVDDWLVMLVVDD